MNILKKITLFICICILFVTCKKETLAPGTTEGQPVFSFSGNINGNALNWQAGVNNYYMYSSFGLDSLPNNKVVYSFNGTLQNTTTTKNSLQIIIHDDTIVQRGSSSNISKSVVPAQYYYTIPGGNSIWDSVVFTPKIYAGTPTSFSYNFGDGGFAIAPNTSPVTHIYKRLQRYTTAVTAGFTVGSPITIFNAVKLIKKSSQQLTIDSLGYTIINDSAGRHTVTMTAYIKGGSAPYSYVWDFGDSGTKMHVIISSNTTLSLNHTYNPAKSDTVLLGVADSFQDTAFYAMFFDTNSSTPRMAYSLSIPAAVPNPYLFSNVTINYTDGQGNVYTSNNAAQPLTSSFVVTSVSDYQNNMNNNPTKMLKVAFNCMLYNGNNIIPASGTAIIAVAYQ